VKEERLLNRILIPIDGSDKSKKALEYALDLAEKCSSEVVLLNVFHEHLWNSMVPNLIPTILPIKEMRGSHQKMLLDALKTAKKLKTNIKISTKLVDGRPAEKIVEVAREGKFDLIIMGSYGLGGVKELFLGSVSDRVADVAPCPVLIVK
jgi:nucleotide-binding universal stress UspA family protein